MRPKISIIMGIYNCEKTLSESIESIINQTYKNWELIMCDDHSSDDTLKIAQRYEIMYPEKIKVIKNNFNISLAPTLNRCLEFATGEYIARQDGDDLSLSNRLEVQLDFLERNQEYDLVGSQMISFDKNGDKGIRGVNVSVPNKFTMVKGTAFCHATILARKKVYEELGGYRVTKYTNRCEDVDLWFRFFEKGFKGYNLKEALYKVRDDEAAYKRRTFKNYFNVFVISFRGFRKLEIPLKYYVYLIKPLITPFIPISLLKSYHIKNKIAIEEAKI